MERSIISRRHNFRADFLLFLTGFLPTLLRCSLSLVQGRVVDVSIGRGQPKSVVLCSLASCGFLSWTLKSHGAPLLGKELQSTKEC